MIMKNNRIKLISGVTVAVCIAGLFSSCSNTASINGELVSGADKEIVVKQQELGMNKVLDTLSTNAKGQYSYKVEVEKGAPEFVYLYYGDQKIASLLLSKGEKVKVVSDTLGNFSVKGSLESEKLKGVEDSFVTFLKEFSGLVEKTMDQSLSNEQREEIGRQVSKKYVEYYRDRVKYILENSKSLTSVNVLFQHINANMPVFGQVTDAIHFNNLADSLEKVYPNSKYINALRNEAKRRQNILEVNQKLEEASVMKFPPLTMPNQYGKKISLHDVDAKLIILNFWSASAAGNKLFNQDVLLPLYKKYHSKGLEIYQVCVDVDKAGWASVVKSQALPWINVCDGLGAASPAIASYNVANAFPVSYFITSEGLVGDRIFNDGNAVRKMVAKYLK